jgi:thymidylate synthase
MEQAEQQLEREPLPLPRLAIRRKPASIFDYQFDDFEILGYESHPHIKAAVAV